MTKIDGGVIRRIRVVEYPYQFVDNPTLPHHRKIDTRLKDKLDDDLSWRQAYMAILLDYYKEVKKMDKLEVPNQVAIHTSKYLATQDAVKEWLECFYNKTTEPVYEGKRRVDRVQFSTLLDHYNRQTSLKMNEVEFSKCLKRYGYETEQKRHISYVLNLMKKPVEEDEDADAE